MNRSGEIAFVKAHACGNDFLVIEEPCAGGCHAQVTRHLCARHTGVGADGIEFLDRRADGSFFLRLFNADGSEAELSGNGTRCVAATLAEREGREQVALGTRGGVRVCRVMRHEKGVWWIESGMGVPRVMPRRIELEGVSGTVDGVMVHVGNPHFVVFTDAGDFSANGMRWQELGARISMDSMFRYGTNVEFVRVLAPDQIAFRIFERGVGPTLSSGTGTSAAAAAAVSQRGCERSLTVVAEGGTQQVAWTGDGDELLLTGPAEIVCTGVAGLHG